MNNNNQLSHTTLTFLLSDTDLNFRWSLALQKDFMRATFQVVSPINRVTGEY